jgi:hypothetical protein
VIVMMYTNAEADVVRFAQSVCSSQETVRAKTI